MMSASLMIVALSLKLNGSFYHTKYCKFCNFARYKTQYKNKETIKINLFLSPVSTKLKECTNKIYKKKKNL